MPRNIEAKWRLPEGLTWEDARHLVKEQFGSPTELFQNDTYYSSSKPGTLLKLRIESPHPLGPYEKCYLVRYNRANQDSVRPSTWHSFNIQDIDAWRLCVEPELHKESVVKKLRGLWIIQHEATGVVARLHLDSLQDLDGVFFEIEICINSTESNPELDKWYTSLIDRVKKIFSLERPESLGYRDLLLQKRRESHTLDWYHQNTHLYWVPTKAFGTFEQNKPVRCLFTQHDVSNDTHLILGIELSLALEPVERKFTLWRKGVSRHYGIHVGVLLFDPTSEKVRLLNLENEKVSTSRVVGHSPILVHRGFLGTIC